MKKKDGKHKEPKKFPKEKKVHEVPAHKIHGYAKKKK